MLSLVFSMSIKWHKIKIVPRLCTHPETHRINHNPQRNKHIAKTRTIQLRLAMFNRNISHLQIIRYLTITFSSNILHASQQTRLSTKTLVYKHFLHTILLTSQRHYSTRNLRWDPTITDDIKNSEDDGYLRPSRPP